MKSTEILLVLKPIITVFDSFSIPYYIGGSLASSVFGMPRSTMDVDIIADIKPFHVPHLKSNLEDEFYIDDDMIKEAIERFSSFNLIHLETAIKIDIFIPKQDDFQANALNRKMKDTLIEDDSTSSFYFPSPEDIILFKLKWYEMGNRVSERQWLDVLGIIKVQEESLDVNYLKLWANQLGILSLMENAFTEAGIQL